MLGPKWNICITHSKAQRASWENRRKECKRGEWAGVLRTPSSRDDMAIALVNSLAEDT